MDDPDWKQYEVAVATFLAALGPTAKVRHDVKIPDAHTGRPRQRDVWIEVPFGHLSWTILVSCKDWNRPLDQQDIDHVNGEFISSGAHDGVIYSSSGFNGPALEKAAQLGFHCCRLYRDQPPEIPDRLVFRSYCITPRMLLALSEPADPTSGLRTWEDVFEQPIDTQDGPATVLDVLAEHFDEQQRTAGKRLQDERSYPTRWSTDCELPALQNGGSPIRIRIGGSWNTYEGKLEAHLLNGSYDFATGGFIGSQTSPSIDTQGSHPGPGWALMESPPKRISSPSWVFFMQSEARRNLLAGFAKTKIPIAG